MSAKVLQAVAVVFIGLALACTVAAISASTKRVEIQGPSAIAVLADGSAWLAVDEALWHLDADGQRTATVDGAALNVGGRIGNLVVHPNGQMVAQVRGDPTLYFLDPATAAIKARLVPQWQPDLVRESSDAINYAFSDDGRVAIAAGGAHAVALFDSAGRFLARTRPGTYEFTNGLWWAGNSLWTTDTNHAQLVELDGATLAEKSRVQLCAACSRWRFLGMAASSHGSASAAHGQPLGTLVRFANGMTQGIATDVFRDGSQLDFPMDNIAEPRDLKWRGNELLLLDNASFSIKRYSESRAPLADFGDAAVQRELQAARAERDAYALQYRGGLAAAVALFVIGLALAARVQRVEKGKTLARLGVDLSQLGTPTLAGMAQVRAVLRLFWPLLLFFALALPLPLLMVRVGPHAKGAAPGAELLVMVLMLALYFAAMWLLRRNVLRSTGDPAAEALLNSRAVQFLATDAAFWRVRYPDELPLEAFILMQGAGRFQWVVLTSQRLLVFVGNLRERVLAHAHARNEVLRVQFVPRAELGWRERLRARSMPLGEAVRIEFKDGTSLAGFTPAGATVRRVAERLQAAALAAPSMEEMHALQVRQARPRPMPARREDALRQAVASLLIPGLGQYLQGRRGTALYFFVAWLFALSGVVAVAWTLWFSLSAVSPAVIAFNAAIIVLIHAAAVSEAWAMRQRVDLPSARERSAP